MNPAAPDAPMTAGTKGIPADLVGRRPEALIGRNVHDGTFSSPLVIAKASAIAHNLETMRRYCAARGVEIAPHAKTTMAPSLVERQLSHGAWGVTAATAVQARALAAMGVTRIMLANQLVHPAAIDWAGRAAAEGLDLYVFVDSQEGVVRLARAASRRRLDQTGHPGSHTEGSGRPSSRHEGSGHPAESQEGSGRMSVLVEVGGEGGRTGVRQDDQVLALAEQAAATDGVRLAGVAGYEGVFLDPEGPDARARVRAYLSRLARAFEQVMDTGSIDEEHPPVLTAGGSACFDDVIDICGPATAAHGGRLVLRSGCYLAHDNGLYEQVSPLRSDPQWPPFAAALEAVGQVISRPEPSLALVDLGKRDVSFDEGLPVPLWHRGPGGGPRPSPPHWEVTALMDQHTYLAVDPADAVTVGDFVSFGISHPCTTFDKWRHIPEVDDDGTVVSVISTEF